jgi:hypothetical protein
MRVIEMIQRVKQRSNREGGKRVSTKFSKLGFGSKQFKFANIVILVFIRNKKRGRVLIKPYEQK